MAVLLAFISLLLVPLNPACFTDPAQEKVSPIINLKLDSRKKMLTWNSRRNVTWQECTIDAPLDPPISQTPQVAEDGTYFCTFSNSVLHRGATLTVNVTSEGHEFQATLTFCNSGREGSGAVNFSCLIYNVHFLNCSWAQGPAAPADVRYHLYTWASLHGNVSECAQYVLDPTGTRVGCHFDQLGEPQTTDNYFFLVNGTSNETDIQFLDFTPFVATEIEKYNPPANLTARNNGSYYVIQWDNPVTRFNISSHVLYYELDIQRKGSFSKTDPVFQRGENRNEYLMPSSAVTGVHTVRVRVRHVYGDTWSEWGPAQPFGFPEKNFTGFLVVLIGLVVGAAALSSIGLMFLCKRFSLKQKLFPPIPQVKRELAGSFTPTREMAWDGDNPSAGSQEPEDFLTVEEMKLFAGREAEVVGPAPALNPYENITAVRGRPGQ
ncbi:granulocyte-macrophage colony-stimulating factor receptor subunit alpha [Camelus dromedarius]|uniref:granulocyte-macrophage colony-stimulating factor receptor subunit alpha n=1 Tax=Camelus dromedarius TaxID=9838 RepID=UPI0031196319